MSRRLLLEKKILSELKKQNAMLCTVESCTGGLIASRLTDVAGASDVIWGALITYHPSAKIHLCRISPKLLSTVGPVSRQVAAIMATGGLKHMQNHLPNKNLIAISTTGIAGPGGGTLRTPVGLCLMGIASPYHQTRTLEMRALQNYPRIKMKHYFVTQSLKNLLNYLTHTGLQRTISKPKKKG